MFSSNSGGNFGANNGGMSRQGSTFGNNNPQFTSAPQNRDYTAKYEHMEEFAQLCSRVYEPDTNLRVNADQRLRELANNVESEPGVLSTMMQLACNTNFEAPIRFQAAAFCRRSIKVSWNPEMAEYLVREDEKRFIRQSIVAALMNAPGPQRSLWADAIKLIAQVDFPRNWPDLLPSICSYLNAEQALSAMAGALQIAHSVFEKYREEEELTEELKEELLPINAAFTTPLLQTGLWLSNQLQSHPDTKEIIVALTNCALCYGDMTFLDLGQEHEDNLTDFMTFLQTGLRYRNSALIGDDTTPGPVTVLHTAVVEVITNHLVRYDEEFDPFVSAFTEDVWKLLQEPTTTKPSADDLVIQCLGFIGGVCFCSHRRIIEENNMLQPLCAEIVIPCLHLRDDVEVDDFFSDPAMYISREIEGSDIHTRRRAAIDLSRSLEVSFSNATKPILQAECMRLLQGDWRSKDAAICLMVALAVKGSTMGKMATMMELQADVPIGEFFDQYIMPELKNDSKPKDPNLCILSADAIRFVAIFRQFLTAQQCIQLIPELGRWLTHPEEVVCTYAAHAIEKMILVREKDDKNEFTDALKISSQNFSEVAELILSTLCERLKMRKGGCNEYMMKCLLTIIKTHPEVTQQYIAPVMQTLAGVLELQVKNEGAGSGPIFSHCMWEAISFGLRIGADFVEDIEGLIWGSLGAIFANEVAQFVPYAMQIIGQIIDIRGNTGKHDFGKFLDLYAPFIADNMFEYKGNIPAVVRVVSAYNRHCCRAIENNNQTRATLEVFGRLINLKQFDHEGFNLLAAMVTHCPPEIIDKYMTEAVQAILNRHQNHQSPKFQRCEVFMFALITAQRGAMYFYDLIEHINKGLCSGVLRNIWCKHQQKVLGAVERKVCVVALTNLALETPIAQDVGALQQALETLLKLLYLDVDRQGANMFMPKVMGLGDFSVGLEDDSAFQQSSVQFNNQFVQLEGAKTPPEDPCASVGNAKEYFENKCLEALRGPNAQTYLAAARQLPREMQPHLPLQ